MKKVVKIAGNLLMVAALIFLVKKIIGMDFDPAQLKQPPVLAALLLNTVVQTGLILVTCYPWLLFTKALSGEKIPYAVTMPVYTKSNLYKYVPGNVFQYVGRNQLAADLQIRHVDVACATILDILCCILGAVVVSVLLLGSTLADLLAQYGLQILLVGGIVLVVAAAGFAVVFWKWKEPVTKYLHRYRAAFSGKGIWNLGKGLGFYIVQNAGSALVYFIALRLVFGSGTSFGELTALTGAFVFAWIIGFVTPGAPGGIGIRESVMLFVCGGSNSDQILLFVLLMRISSIAADVFACCIGQAYAWRKKKQLSSHS